MHCVEIWDWRGQPSVGWRLGLLASICRMVHRRGGRLVAFGMGDDLRLVLAAMPIDGFARAVRIAIGRRGGRSSGHAVHVARTAHIAAVWAHRQVDGAPLAAPWTSHRDLLGYRRSGWVRPWPAARAGRLHADLGGGVLPGTAPSSSTAAIRRRAAAATLGRELGDPSTFALVARMGRAQGLSLSEAAAESTLSRRRVAQLGRHRGRLVGAGLTATGDPRLLVWPVGLAGSGRSRQVVASLAG